MNNLHSLDAFFSSEVFLSTRAKFADELAKAQEPQERISFTLFDRLRPEMLRALEREFDNLCGYCNRHIGITAFGAIDHFLPKSKFPERALEHDNLILACQACNAAKRDYFPISATGKPLLLNPRTDDFSIHLQEQDDGTLRGLTPEGLETISVLRLNRPGLVEDRLREHKFQRLVAERPELHVALLEGDSHARFLASMLSVISLNKVAVSAIHNQPFRLMLYANIITCLETYLSDTLIATAKSSRPIMRKFVETFSDFREIKFTLAEVFDTYDQIEQKAIEAMAGVLYHNLAKVREIYRNTLGVEFLGDMGPLFRAVIVRHDIVHRNGKDKDGATHVLSSDQIETLANQVTQFVERIEDQINEIRRQSKMEEE